MQGNVRVWNAWLKALNLRQKKSGHLFIDTVLTISKRLYKRIWTQKKTSSTVGQLRMKK